MTMRVSEIVGEAPKTASIPNSWLSIVGWEARKLMVLDQAVKANGVDPNDLEAVKATWDGLVRSGEIDKLERTKEYNRSRRLGRSRR